MFGSSIISFLSRRSQSDAEFRRGRLGYYRDFRVPAGGPRVWFHAASVGEATGGVPTLQAFKRKFPGAGAYFSSGTPHGLAYARGRLPEDVAVLPFPLDLPASVSRALDTLRPDLFVSFETEFWPNFYRELGRRGKPALLLNGRVSESSARLYRALSPLFKPVFRQFDRMAMHSPEDMERAVRIGAPRDKVVVLGSSKYDGLIEKAKPERAEIWKKLLRIGGGRPVVIGGSLRGAECIALMRIFRDMRSIRPDLLAVFAPRHLYNIPRMRRWLDEEKIPYDLLSEVQGGARLRESPVVLVDSMGALFEIYSTGDLIFCGGTLEPVGGHNILEPAAWSRAVFYGPHLKKIHREHRILRNFEGSFPVADPDDLLAQWKKWITGLDDLRVHGRNARAALVSLGGVVDRQVGLIQGLLSGKAGLKGE